MKSILVSAAIAVCFVACDTGEQAREQSNETAQDQPATDIWTAAATGNQEVIEQHVARGADLDAKEPAGGGSPLIVAAVYGQAEAAELLLENGASLDIKNKDGATALHVAAFFCHPDVVRLLLEKGADVTARNGFGQTPLETISGEWNSDVEGLYQMVSGMWNLELDLERIREARPKAAELLRQYESRS